MDIDLLVIHSIKFDVQYEMTCRIVRIYKDITIFIRENKLRGPSVLSQVIPQGFILSPTLVNIYTAGLHDMLNDSNRGIKCVQYADDFCIYGIKESYKDCIMDLEYIMQRIKAWITTFELILNLEKCSITCFTRSRLSLPLK